MCGIVEGGEAGAHEEAAVVEAHLVVGGADGAIGLAIEAIEEVGHIAAGQGEVARHGEVDGFQFRGWYLHTLHLFSFHACDGLGVACQADALFGEDEVGLLAFPTDGEQAGVAVEGGQACAVAVAHLAGIDRDGVGTGGSPRAPGDGVAGIEEGGGRKAGQLHPFAGLGEAACGGLDVVFLVVVVPLIVFCDDSVVGLLVAVALAIYRHGEGDASIAVGAEHGPAVYPRAGFEGEHTPHPATVLEHHAPPLAVLAIDDGALACQGEAAEVALEDDLGVVGAFDVLAAVGDFFASGAGPGDAEEVVHAVVLDHTAALVESLRTAIELEGLADASGLFGGEVGSEFDQLDVATAGEDIDAVIVVEEEGGVVVGGQTAVERPALGGVVGAEDHRLVGVVVGHEECPEGAFVVAERGGPLAAPIDGALLQVVARGVLDAVEEVGDGLPVHEVGGAHDGRTGEHVHGGGDEVVVVAHADDVGVGTVGPDEGVFHLDGLPCGGLRERKRGCLPCGRRLCRCHKCRQCPEKSSK